jgi:DNA replication and repair protein RecF
MLWGKMVLQNQCIDAIHHLSYGKSYFNPLAVKTSNTEKSFVIDAAFIKNERTEQVVCSLKKRPKKSTETKW